MTKARVEIRGRSFLKYRDVDGAQYEVLASEHGRVIGHETGLFDVPQILSHDASGGMIEFERISNELHVRRALSEGRLPVETMKALGACLAAIHKTSPPQGVCDIAADWFTPDLNLAPVFLHGDFQIENILYETLRGTLFLVDWSAPAWLGGQGNRGPACIDLGTFILSLFVRRPFERFRIPQPEIYADHFLAGYTEAYGDETEIANLKRCFSALVDAYTAIHRSPKGRLRILVRAASLTQVRRYVLDYG